jgi:predicted ATPase
MGKSSALHRADAEAIYSVLRGAHAGSATFSDRGIPDTLGYARLIGLPDVRSRLTACDQYRYASLVLLAPAWKEIYETDDERKQGFNEAERTCELESQVYRDCGYHRLELPKVPSKHRADFVLSRLHLQTKSLRDRSQPGAQVGWSPVVLSVINALVLRNWFSATGSP